VNDTNDPPRAVSSRLPERVDLAHLGEGRAVVNHITRAAHSEALMVRGAGYDADRLDQPRARAARSFRTVGERLKKAPLTSRCVQLCTAVCSCVQLCTAVYSCVQLA
jgi:hypothetical protein